MSIVKQNKNIEAKKKKPHKTSIDKKKKLAKKQKLPPDSTCLFATTNHNCFSLCSRFHNVDITVSLYTTFILICTSLFFSASTFFLSFFLYS